MSVGSPVRACTRGSAMHWLTHALRDLPIKRKLAITTTVTVGAALLLTCGGLLAYEQIMFRRTLTHDLSIMAQVIGVNSAAGLALHDVDAVEQALRGLTAHPHVVAACVYDAEGRVFASYREPEFTDPWPAPLHDTEYFGSDSLDLFRAVSVAGENIGTIYVRSDLDEMHVRMKRYVSIAGGVILFAAVAAMMIAGRLQRVISEPISALAAIAEKVAAEKNYGIRGTKLGNDELGRLIDGFNDMLTQIQARDLSLQNAHDQLEKRVADRTAELAKSLSLLNATLDSIDEGILVVESDGGITCFNEKFGAMWRLPAAALQNPTYDELLRLVGAQVKFRDKFVQRVAELMASPDNPSRDLIELADGQMFERYTRPHRVDGRTVGIVASFRDITQRKRAEAELQHAHQKLVETSRRAGMAEVATGVLHNVGNVLTSVNVSATIIAEQVRQSKAGMIAKVSELLSEQRASLPSFFATDPRAQQLPDYLGILSRRIRTEQADVLHELESLCKNIGHIKDIVAMQQNYAKVSGVAESVSIVELVEDALRMNAGALLRHDVTLVREFHADRNITVEKHKVLQVLVNLIRNAKYACDESGRPDKTLRVRVTEHGERIHISVIDNGVGIPAENLTRIFGHGFTTRKDGHGFGLHSGALAAKELGGALTVHSDGPGRGARFTLSIPVQLKAAA